MKKIIYLFTAALILAGCSSGQSKTTVSGTTSLPAGTLDTYDSAMSYKTSDLAHFLLGNVCLSGTTSDDCTRNQENLAESYNFLLSQVESVTDGVTAYTVTYSSPGIIGENRKLSGEVLVPNLDPSEIKGVFLYFHGTSIGKHDVPSCLGGIGAKVPSYCGGLQTYDSERLAAIIASQGYIVVTPDYVGQGIDDQVMHPYILYPENNSIAGINMLSAARTLLDKIGYTNSFDLYLSGLSEGGAYSLWATRYIQTTYAKIIADNKYTLKHTIALSGAYDLNHAQMPMELTNVAAGDSSPYNILNTATATSTKPMVISNVLTAYAFYDLNQEYGDVFAKAFLDCPPCKISGKAYNIAGLFLDPNLDLPNIEGFITASAALTGYGVNGDNSVKALAIGGLENDPTFTQKLDQASITSFVTNTPIDLVYLAHDSVVTNLNSINAFNGIKAASGEDKVKADIIDNSLFVFHDEINNVEAPIDHSQSQPFHLIAALSKMTASTSKY